MLSRLSWDPFLLQAFAEHIDDEIDLCRSDGEVGCVPKRVAATVNHPDAMYAAELFHVAKAGDGELLRVQFGGDEETCPLDTGNGSRKL